MAENAEGGADAGAAPESSQPEDAQAAPAAPPLVVLSQFIKDLSFEAPAAPAIFNQMVGQKPNINVNVGVQANPIEANQYEVFLEVRASCQIGEAMAFLVELTYGGVFAVNVTDELLRPVLLVECPRMLFPFARNIVANATSDGGFMPLMLAPVDFVALYQRQMQEAQANASAGEAPTATA